MQPSKPSLVRRVILGVIAVVLIWGSFGTVSAGNTGIKTRFSKVVGTVNPGLYFKIPLMDSVSAMNTQTQKEQVDAEAASSDLQTVHATVAVNYNVNESKVGELFTNIGVNYGTKVIDPAIQEAVKSSTAKYTAEELITKRPEVTDSIKSELTSKLSLSGISVTGVSIVNFDFSATFNAAIEAKVTAEQDALAAKNKLAQVQYEAQQTVASAQAQAEAIKIQTEAITNGGGQSYVQLQSIKVQQSAVDKWNGVLPTQMIPGSTVPFINLNN